MLDDASQTARNLVPVNVEKHTYIYRERKRRIGENGTNAVCEKEEGDRGKKERARERESARESE